MWLVIAFFFNHYPGGQDGDPVEHRGSEEGFIYCERPLLAWHVSY